MKIWLLTLDYPPAVGGVAHYYGCLVRHWPPSGRGEPAGSLNVVTNEQKKLVNGWPLIGWLPAFFWLAKMKAKKQGDYFLIGQILPLGTAAMLVNYFFKLDYAVLLHGLDFNLASTGGRKKWLTKKILNRAHKIICANSYTSSQVKNFAPAVENKLNLVNPGVEPQSTGLNLAPVFELRRKHGLENKLILLTVGRLIKRKGVDQVIKSLPEVLKIQPNLVYVVIGNGPELDNYQRLAKKLGLQNNIIFLSSVDDKEKILWYYAGDIFIMVSRNLGADVEGFGIVYLEAGLAGKPVIACKTGGVADAVADEVNGLLVDPESIKQISAAILRLAEFKGLRERLGVAGQKRANEQFNWQGQAKKMFEIIKN